MTTKKLYSFGEFLKIVNDKSFWYGKRNLDYWEVYHSKYFIDDILRNKTHIEVRNQPVNILGVMEYARIKASKQ